jgi:hypothetical protein
MRHKWLLVILVCLMARPTLASTTFIPPPAPASVAQGKFVYESIKNHRKDVKRLTEAERDSLELYMKSLKK